MNIWLLFLLSITNGVTFAQDYPDEGGAHDRAVRCWRWA